MDTQGHGQLFDQEHPLTIQVMGKEKIQPRAGLADPGQIWSTLVTMQQPGQQLNKFRKGFGCETDLKSGRKSFGLLLYLEKVESLKRSTFECTRPTWLYWQLPGLFISHNFWLFSDSFSLTNLWLYFYKFLTIFWMIFQVASLCRCLPVRCVWYSPAKDS